MANEEHLKILKQGVEVWNKWRDGNPGIEPELSGADLGPAILSHINLSGADLSKVSLDDAELMGANFQGANLSEAKLNNALIGGVANLHRADLSGTELRKANLILANLQNANLEMANLNGANLAMAKLQSANLKGANLAGADLMGANLSEATLTEANLRGARFLDTCLKGTKLSNSRIYGISAWNLKTDKETEQNSLIITKESEPDIKVDNLEVAQFVYLLLNNKKISDVIDTIGKKGVLILGRFTKERKAVLDAIWNKLRELGFVSMMFDFEKSSELDFTGTIKTLAGLSRFIIADITNPKSSPLELQATMPDYMIPFVPIIRDDEEPFAMFQDLQQKYGDWVLDVLRYDSADNLLKVLDNAVVKPALKKADELLIKKAEGIRDRHVKDYL